MIPTLYIQSPETGERYARPEFLWLVCPLLLYWLGRMALLAGRGGEEGDSKQLPGNDDPLVFSLQDRTSWLTGALDFPVRSGTAALLDRLDEITHRHGGRVYLAKDVRCAPERVREGYPRLGAFEAVRAEAAGAPPRFASELSRRLAL